MSDEPQLNLGSSPTDGQSRHSPTYMRRSIDGRPTQVVGENGSVVHNVLHIDVKPVHQAQVNPPKIQPDQIDNLAEHKRVVQTVSMSDIQPANPHAQPQTEEAKAWRNTSPAVPRQKRSLVLQRSNFGPKIMRKTRSRIRRSSRNRPHTFRIAFTLLLIAVGAGVAVNAVRIDYLSKNQVAVLAKTTGNSANSIEQVDETQPDSTSYSGYSVAADLPKYLRIPKIQVDARVQRLGAKTNSELAAPTNIFDIGWYENSGKPGEDGTVLLDGQVTGPTKQGVFYSLGSLNSGDKIEIERGDGTRLHYTVVRSQLYDYDKVDMNAALKSAIPSKPGLNLISYSSRFDVRANKFESRLVVFAVLE